MYFLIYSRFLHTLFFSYYNSLVMIDLISLPSKRIVKKKCLFKTGRRRKRFEKPSLVDNNLKQFMWFKCLVGLEKEKTAKTPSIALRNPLPISCNMKKEKLQSKAEQNVEISMGPVTQQRYKEEKKPEIHVFTACQLSTNEIHVITACQLLTNCCLPSTNEIHVHTALSTVNKLL